MKSASPALQAFLLNPPANYYQVDLFTFTLVGGTVLRYTSGGDDIKLDGHIFSSLGPFLKRSNIREAVGLEVPEISIKIIADPSHQVASIPILQALQQGMFDSADVKVERLFMATYGDTSLGTVTRFAGTVADLEKITRIDCTIKVKGRPELLDRPLPVNIIQPSCRHTLFDAGCALDRASFVVTGVVSTGSSKSIIQTDLTQPDPIGAPNSAPLMSESAAAGCNMIQRLYFATYTYVTALGETTPSPQSSLTIPAHHIAHVASPSAIAGALGWNVYVGLKANDEEKQNGDTPIAFGTAWTEPVPPKPLPQGLRHGSTAPQIATNGYFKQGVVQFNSGPNAGQSRVIVHYESGALTVIPPLPFAPAPGDTFSAVPGCDKSLNVCRNKFINSEHFGGQPWVPSPDDNY